MRYRNKIVIKYHNWEGLTIVIFEKVRALASIEKIRLQVTLKGSQIASDEYKQKKKDCKHSIYVRMETYYKKI